MGKKDLIGKIYFAIIASVILTFVIGLSGAYPTEPIGPHTLTVQKSTRMLNTSYGPKTTWAEAGNITELSINATSATKSWQGYYGNVSGKLTLDDSTNNTLYDWTDLEPRGEIFASINSSVNWPTIRCFNFSGPDSGGQVGTNWTSTGINATSENNRTGLTDMDSDAINNTFTWGTHKEFLIGTVVINESYCNATATYVSNTSQAESIGANFVEVLLTDGNPGNALVFATFIENQDPANDTDEIGFDSYSHDFQMLVLEDGRSIDHADLLTRYYFWVELE
ncbi:hypothetical protein KJ680_14250 [bacterium]|nr:hypothetical protein [bacterium]